MILIVDLNYPGSLGYQEFVRPLEDIIGEETDCTVCHYSQVTSIKGYDGVVLSGTALKDDVYLEKINEFSWLHTCSVPLLGICAGMQVISLQFSSLLFFCTEIGMVEVFPVAENKLIPSPISAFELHTHGITLPQQFVTIACSTSCIQGIKHREKDMYGILFHPEVRNQHIIQEFLNLI
ncbi:MAG: hypothetical protein HXS47_10770 [Theionarchaea archaeon]|nr:hypothetical protein [Theionarchaea archaeon]